MNSRNGRLLTSVILQQVTDLEGSKCEVLHEQPIFGTFYFDHCTLNGHLSHTGYRCFYIPPNIRTNNA